MSDQPPEGPRKDWMEIWYETGEITWQKPLSPEAQERITNLIQQLSEEQSESDE